MTLAVLKPVWVVSNHPSLVAAKAVQQRPVQHLDFTGYPSLDAAFQDFIALACCCMSILLLSFGDHFYPNL